MFNIKNVFLFCILGFLSFVTLPCFSANDLAARRKQPSLRTTILGALSSGQRMYDSELERQPLDGSTRRDLDLENWDQRKIVFGFDRAQLSPLVWRRILWELANPIVNFEDALQINSALNYLHSQNRNPFSLQKRIANAFVEFRKGVELGLNGETW